jgi:hypothetical protein
MATFDQVVPPSWVAHSSGPNAQPLRGSANRRPPIPDGRSPMLARLSGIDASGVGIRRQVRPPSVVRTIAAQGEPEHAARPSSQPSEGDTKVRETGTKPSRADPGPAPTTGDGLGVDVGLVMLGPNGVAAATGVAPGGGLAVIAGLVEAVVLPQPASRAAVIR